MAFELHLMSLDESLILAADIHDVATIAPQKLLMTVVCSSSPRHRLAGEALTCLRNSQYKGTNNQPILATFPQINTS